MFHFFNHFSPYHSSIFSLPFSYFPPHPTYPPFTFSSPFTFLFFPHSLYLLFPSPLFIFPLPLHLPIPPSLLRLVIYLSILLSTFPLPPSTLHLFHPPSTPPPPPPIARSRRPHFTTVLKFSATQVPLAPFAELSNKIKRAKISEWKIKQIKTVCCF